MRLRRTVSSCAAGFLREARVFEADAGLLVVEAGRFLGEMVVEVVKALKNLPSKP